MQPKLREVLFETIAENKRHRNFIRIYPAQGSIVYDKYFETIKSYNRMLYQCLYGRFLFAEGNEPTKALMPRVISSESKNEQKRSILRSETESKSTNNTSVVTFDDSLTEYLRRLEELIKNIDESNFREIWRHNIIEFLNDSI